jgi:dethiobiotin synthetase
LRNDKPFSPDAFELWEAAGRPGTLEQVCPQLFVAPLAPHLAARAEGKRVDPTLLLRGFSCWQREFDIVLVEGAGGLMSPISDVDYNADLAHAFGYPLIVVAANVLGTINATLQTLIAAANYDNFGERSPLKVAGVVLNSPQIPGDLSSESNAGELAFRCDAPLLAVVHHNGNFDRDVDWATLI